jgi:CRP-like cAMP-binding protein
LETRVIRSSSSSTAWRRCELRSELVASYSRVTFFGEMSLVDGEPRSATIVATTDLLLLIVDRFHFWRLLDETPDLIRRILTILSRRVRRLEQTVDAKLHGTNPA